MALDTELLKSVTLFAGLDEKEAKKVASLFKERNFSDGEAMAEEGKHGIGFFVIESGEATVSQDDRRLRTLRDGDFFGEVAILRTGERTASVVARTQMRLIAVSEAGFRRLVETDPSAAQACEAAIAERWAAPT